MGTNIIFGIVIAIIIIAAVLYAIGFFMRKKNQEKLNDLEKRKELLEAFYEERFGTKEERHGAKYYAVAPEQNIGETEIQELFRRNGVG